MVAPQETSEHHRQQEDQMLEALQLPQQLTIDHANLVQERLLAASWHVDTSTATAQVLPEDVLLRLIKKATSFLKDEPTLLEICPAQTQQRVTVVGDTHGHYQDLCHLFEKFGAPSKDRIYIFNGDFVDRGAWGLETLTVLATYKVVLPNNVFLLRGNHEAAWCTEVYGFKSEVKAKYGTAWKGIFTELKKLFAALPLAAVVEHNTLILHGGLFRAPPPKVRGLPAVRSLDQVDAAKLKLGTLDDLRRASKGGADPDPEKNISQLIASDVGWSDPSKTPGLYPNKQRGVGTTFGADITEQFLKENGLRLIVRSHEGPDARIKRPLDDRMPSIDDGLSVDHQTPSGKLVTLFSAPCYPMFVPDGEQRNTNKGAVLHLAAPDYAKLEVETFEAVMPRPQAAPYYTPDPCDASVSSDEESMLEEDTSCSSHGEAAAWEAGSSGKVNNSAGGSAQQQQLKTADPTSSKAQQTAGLAAADGQHNGHSEKRRRR